MKMHRRNWIRGVSGAMGVALMQPFVAQLARAQQVTPHRFIFVVEGNCFEPVTLLSDAARTLLNDRSRAQPLLTRALSANDRWWVTGGLDYAHDAVIDVDTAGVQNTALAAVEEQNLLAQSRVLYGMSSQIIGGGHFAAHGCLSSARSINGVPGGITIDAWLAANTALATDMPVPVLRVGVSDDLAALDFNLCAEARGRPAPMFTSAPAAFDALFSSVATPQSQVRFEQQLAQLQFAQRDVERAAMQWRGSAQEKQKLLTYQASLEALVSRHNLLSNRRTSLERVVPTAPPPHPSSNVEGFEDPIARFRSQLRLVSAAMMGGLTQIAVVGCGTTNGLKFNYPGAPVDRHNLHHGSSDPAYLRIIHDVTKQQVAAIVGMAKELEAVAEGNGTMLDNTLIVFISDNGEQHHSEARDFPTLLLGGGAMLNAASSGKTLFYPGLRSGNHRQVSNLWNTIGTLGLNDPARRLVDFGAEGRRRVATGPLDELIS
jgi:hypothetical protein